MSGRIDSIFNDGWSFQLVREGETYDDNRFFPVNLPHDWLIYDCEDLYQDGTGYYRKVFCIKKQENRKYFINFDGVYMDSVVFVNGKEVGVNHYGYSSFEFDITGFLKDGENEIKVEVRFRSPNSRWYSGAGIFRDVRFIEVDEVHIANNGVYVYSELLSRPENHKEQKCLNECLNRGEWKVSAEIEVDAPDCEDLWSQLSVGYFVYFRELSSKAGECFCRNVDFKDIPSYYYADSTENIQPEYITERIESDRINRRFFIEFTIRNARIWDVTSPESYDLVIALRKKGEEIDTYSTGFGLRTIEFTVDNGFFLNGRNIKINGACEHHDLGLFGAAFNKDAMRRKISELKEMGVNAIRTSHNMPAKCFMELADEMGIMVDSEAFDMWRRPKTEFDYARFFEEDYKKDIRSWIRRDRNHPSVIMWSIGNEIYDCHADESAPELTADMKNEVEKYDHAGNGIVTHASNFMAWEGARKCAKVLKLAGYNYGERLYDEQHKAHPEWKIYGSETCSTIQSRGIYHFPLSVSIMADDDEQCSSLGNCATSWGAPNTEYVITMDRDRKYSQGQFIWTGFDYIGEPTPYHTKNSYFGQIDTAGFPKDTYFIFKGSWTDPNKSPFVHIFPYWDFNEGQIIDVRVASNCDAVELYFSDADSENKGYTLVGRADIDHEKGNILAPSWQIPFHRGELKAAAYLNGVKVAECTESPFGDAYKLNIKKCFEGEEILFFEINAFDKDGKAVKNANSRINVAIEGAGELVGLDNGDSTDNENYKTDSRRLFSGKLMAAVSVSGKKGVLKIKVSSPGLVPAEYVCEIKPVPCDAKNHDVPLKCKDIQMERNIIELDKSENRKNEIPARTIKLKVVKGNCISNEFGPDCREITVKAEICPPNAGYTDIKWAAVNEKAVPTNLVALEPYKNEEGYFCRLTAKGDGEFRLRASSNNGERVAKIISVLEFKASGLGKAFINPYEFVSGSLYTDGAGEIGNGNEKGIATPRGENSYFGFENVDFGEIGSDQIDIPIFTLDDAEYKIGIWDGVPGQSGSTLLCDGRYCKKSIWNVYQEESYKLDRKLTGIKNIYFTSNDKYHFKGFIFRKPQKAFEKLGMNLRSRIYGDTYTVVDDEITGIGNNVTIEFDGMDFGKEAPRKIIICGRSKLKNNSIHLKFDGPNGTKTELLEFEGSDSYIERSFDINGAEGENTVGFVFLPGCDFDFKYFRLEK